MTSLVATDLALTANSHRQREFPVLVDLTPSMLTTRKEFLASPDNEPHFIFATSRTFLGDRRDWLQSISAR